MHAFRWSTFFLLLTQKFQQVKTCFPTPSTKVFPVSPPYLPISYMLFQVCLSCYIVLSTFLNLNAMGKIPVSPRIYHVIDCHGKNWLKALTNLMHTLLLLHLINMNHCD